MDLRMDRMNKFRTGLMDLRIDRMNECMMYGHADDYIVIL